MAISPAAIRELRELTGAGVLDCKQALEEAGGNLEKAAAVLKSRGVAIAAQKAERETTQGVIQAYIHHDNRYGALVELNCESDFVARTDEFRQLAQDIAMQVAAMNPPYLSREHSSQPTSNGSEQPGLLDQPFIKDEKQTIEDLIKHVISRTGENIRVSRFVRFKLGEEAAQAQELP